MSGSSIRPPSWRPTVWQERFIGSSEPRIALEGHGGCGKERCLIEAAAHGADHDPLWRAVIIAIGHDAKAAMVRATDAVYSRMGATWAAEFSQWTFAVSGAIVRVAGSVQEARAGTGYDTVCLHHLEEFRDSEIEDAKRLLRRVPGRTPRLRATRRVERDWRRHFPSRITFDGADDEIFADPSPEASDLERIVVALTHHQHERGARGADTWAAVLDAVRLLGDGPHDAETVALVKSVEAIDGDEARLVRALERARHHLAEMQGGDAGACHATCPPTCYLRREAAGYSVDITPR